MRREFDETRTRIRQLAQSARKHAGEETSAILKAQWELLAGNYVRLVEQSKQNGNEETFGDPIPWDRQPH